MGCHNKRHVFTFGILVAIENDMLLVAPTGVGLIGVFVVAVGMLAVS